MTTTASTYNCRYCKREYREKFNYDRHIQCCEFTFKSRREQNNEIDMLAPAPSHHEMYQFIQHLSVRVDKLEKENKRLHQVARKKQNLLELKNKAKKAVLERKNTETEIKFLEDGMKRSINEKMILSRRLEDLMIENDRIRNMKRESVVDNCIVAN